MDMPNIKVDSHILGIFCPDTHGSTVMPVMSMYGHICSVQTESFNYRIDLSPAQVFWTDDFGQNCLEINNSRGNLLLMKLVYV